MTYIIIDLANMFFRARHSINGNADLKLGMAFHIVLNSIKKAWQDFNGSHVVFCLEGRSWRKDFYAPYKRNRSDARAAHTEAEAEAEEEKVFWEAFDMFKTFIDEKTNCTVLHNPRLEADDLIAGWIQAHGSDSHIIISTDSDFHQLIASNVRQYDGVTDTTISLEGFFDKNNKKIIDNKTKEAKLPPDPNWILFEKCIRGDSSDNVFSAYPGVRKAGTKKKVGLLEAYEDRNTKGFNWNNLMLQRWVDKDGVDHVVKDDYERNKTLIDLTAQPTDIKELIVETINNATTANKNISQVGMKLMKFCGLYDLKRISDNARAYADPLNAPYKQIENNV